MNDLPALLQGFFTGKLVIQRQASPATVASYRDTFTLLLAFAAARAGRRTSCRSPTWTPGRSARSSPTWRKTGAAASRPATPGWPRSARSSATPPCTIPSTRS